MPSAGLHRKKRKREDYVERRTIQCILYVHKYFVPIYIPHTVTSLLQYTSNPGIGGAEEHERTHPVVCALVYDSQHALIRGNFK